MQTLSNRNLIRLLLLAALFSFSACDFTTRDPSSASTTFGQSFPLSSTPVISSISPNSGSPSGGTVVSISGSNFLSGLSVTFGGVNAQSVTLISATQIAAVTPAGSAGESVDVAVQNAGGFSTVWTGGFTYANSQPTTSLSVSTLYPSGGPSSGGTLVTVVGSGFVSGITVSLGTAACEDPFVYDSTVLVCTSSSAAAGPVNVSVQDPNGSQAILAGGYTYLPNQNPAPELTSVTPSTGAVTGNTFVTLVGTNFLGGMTAQFGGVPCSQPAVVSSTTMTCLTPPHSSGTVSVSIENLDGQSSQLASAFNFQGQSTPPTITSMSISTAASGGGYNATIQGSGFANGATVTFGGTAATSVTVSSTSQISCVVPASTQSTVEVVVTVPNGQSASYSFTNTEPSQNPAPTLTSLSPNSGSTAGGTAVTITGTNFVSGASVRIDGNTANSIQLVNSTTITCTTPADTAGQVNVSVTNPDGQEATLPTGFTYVAPAVDPAPTLTAIAPNSGPTAGGTAVTVTGTNFVAGATVQIDGNTANSIQVVNSTTITCTTPADSAGQVDVSVTNPDGQEATLPTGFTYTAPASAPAPTVSAIAPNSGPAAGGTLIKITGTNFVTGATVQIDGNAANSIQVVNSTTITCTTPADSDGAVDVTITNPDGQTATLSGGFTYSDPTSGNPPSVSSISPTSGTTAGGTPVTITGTNFVSGATVQIDGNTANSIQVVNSTTITCTTPSDTAGQVDVTVINPDQQEATLSGGYNYVAPTTTGPAPTLSAISPNSGTINGGTAVTLTGTNFVNGAVVDIDGSLANTITVVSATQITCTTPSDTAGQVDVTVVNPDGQQATLSGGYTYVADSSGGGAPPPSLSSISPTSGPAAGGTVVTITGTNFVKGATVQIDGTTASSITVVNATTITCSTPSDSDGQVDVTVINPDGQQSTLSGGFTYSDPQTDPSTSAPAPTLQSISPNSGPTAGGTPVTLSGANFVKGTTVQIDGNTASSVQVVNATTITCSTPADSAGAVDVAVINPDGQQATLSGGFTYSDPPPPQVNSMAPLQGNTLGGTQVTLTGSGFNASSIPSFDGMIATNIKIVSSSVITCDSPPDQAGDVDVVVTNSDGQQSSAQTFTYVAPPPTVSSISPASGYAQGGAAVTITGANFQPGATVLFDGSLNASSVNVASSTTITCLVPSDPGAAQVDVTVVNPDSQQGTLNGGFTYITPATAAAFINVNGGGNVYLYTDQGAVIYWSSANAVSCEVDWQNDSAFLTSGLSGSIGSPPQDAVNDDIFGVTCSNAVGTTTNAEVSVSRMAYAVGETKFAHYVLASAEAAARCADRVRANKSCAPYVRVGRTRDVINQNGIAYDDPGRCRCAKGGEWSTYNWF